MPVSNLRLQKVYPRRSCTEFNRHVDCFNLVAFSVDLSRDQVNSIELSPSTSYRRFTHPIPQVIGRFDNASESTEFNLKNDNYFCSLHSDGIVSLDLDFKMQFGNCLLIEDREQIQQGWKQSMIFQALISIVALSVSELP